MLLHIRQILKIQKKIPCRFNKVTTGVHVTPPPFRLIRKHHSYANYNKKNISVVTYICYYTSEKWINTQNDTLLKKMGDFIEPGTHRSTNIKVKIETL